MRRSLQVPALDHLRDESTAKVTFGTYNILAAIVHILPSIGVEANWAKQLAKLLREFPVSHAVTIRIDVCSAGLDFARSLARLSNALPYRGATPTASGAISGHQDRPVQRQNLLVYEASVTLTPNGGGPVHCE